MKESDDKALSIPEISIRNQMELSILVWSDRDFGHFGRSDPRGGDSHMKQTGMLVVLLRGVNFGFWSRLRCSEQSANILSRQGLV